MLFNTFTFALLLRTWLFSLLLHLNVLTELTMGTNGFSLWFLRLFELSKWMQFWLYYLFLVLKFGVFKEKRFFIFLPKTYRFIALWIKFEFYIDLHNKLSDYFYAHTLLHFDNSNINGISKYYITNMSLSLYFILHTI